jgi:hypothetical protein
MIAAPRLPTVGRKSFSIQSWSFTFSAAISPACRAVRCSRRRSQTSASSPPRSPS